MKAHQSYPIQKNYHAIIAPNLSAGLHVFAWHDNAQSWASASDTDFATHDRWHRLGYTYYQLACFKPCLPPDEEPMRDTCTDQEAIVALNIQQEAFKGDTYNRGWRGGTVLKAARLGLVRGRELEAARHADIVKRQQESITSLQIKLSILGLECSAAKAAKNGMQMSMDAKTIACNGLTKRLALVQQALDQAI